MWVKTGDVHFYARPRVPLKNYPAEYFATPDAGDTAIVFRGEDAWGRIGDLLRGGEVVENDLIHYTVL